MGGVGQPTQSQGWEALGTLLPEEVLGEQAQGGQAQGGQTQGGQTQGGQALGRAGPGRRGPGRAGPGRAGPGRTGPRRASPPQHPCISAGAGGPEPPDWGSLGQLSVPVPGLGGEAAARRTHLSPSPGVACCTSTRATASMTWVPPGGSSHPAWCWSSSCSTSACGRE